MTGTTPTAPTTESLARLRADSVGSLLRPEGLRRAYEDFTRVLQGVAVEESGGVYADADDIARDVVATLRDMIEGLTSAGCAYVHVDVPGFTSYVDEAAPAAIAARGEDAGTLLQRSVDAGNQVFDAFPDTVSGCTSAGGTAGAGGTAKATTTPSPSSCSAPCAATGRCWSTTPSRPVASSRCAWSHRGRSRCSA